MALAVALVVVQAVYRQFSEEIIWKVMISVQKYTRDFVVVMAPLVNGVAPLAWCFLERLFARHTRVGHNGTAPLGHGVAPLVQQKN